jgi:hypothetical protein
MPLSPPSSCPHAVRPGKFRSIIQILQPAAIGQVTRRLAPWELTVGLGGSRSWRALRNLEIPPLACWELQARCTKGLDGVGKTSVAQVDSSGSRAQKPIIASGQQRSPDAYEVQCSTVQSTLLRTAFQLPTGPMCCHDINPTFSPSILFHPSFSQRR